MTLPRCPCPSHLTYLECGNAIYLEDGNAAARATNPLYRKPERILQVALAVGGSGARTMMRLASPPRCRSVNRLSGVSWVR